MLSVKVVDVLLVERAKPGFFMVGIGTPVSLESTKNTQHELEKTRWKIPFVIGTTASLLSVFLTNAFETYLTDISRWIFVSLMHLQRVVCWVNLFSKLEIPMEMNGRNINVVD